MVNVQLNDLDSAIADFRRTVALAPDDAQSYFNLGVLYGRKDETAKALDAYQHGLALDPANVAANQNYALMLMAQNRYRDAVAPLERLMRASPGVLAVRTTLIECLAKTDMRDELSREVKALIAAGSSLPESLKTAKSLVDDKQTDAAQLMLQHAVEIAPDSAEAHYDLGLLLLNGSDYENAVRQFGRAVQIAPDVAQYSMRMAESLILWKHHGTALEFLKAVRDRFGTLPDYRYKLGLTYYSLHQYPLAIAEFDQIAQEQPALDSNHFFLANSYAATGRLEEAETHYRRAIELQPRNASYYTALAQVLRKMSDDKNEEAIVNLKKALALDPDDLQAKQELGLCLVKKTEYDQALTLLLDVVSKEPDLTSAHVALAQVYYKLHRKQDGDRERATVRRLQAAEQARAAPKS